MGVDVFFVISGYLIIGSLAREAATTGRIDLAAFYRRRIRRLMPAATLVLSATTLAALLILPTSRWTLLSKDVIASGLQVQNWNLAFGSTSYEQAGGPVSIFQHFWSLAVEEQFYLVVPLFILLVARRIRGEAGARRRRLILTSLSLLLALSLVHSVVWSTTNPGVAYFATTTRLWELLAGGILAICAPKLGHRSADVAFVVGAALIGYSAATFATALPFPGWIAGVPVVGTLLVLCAGYSRHNSPGFVHVLSVRPSVFLGNISYSLYLWHWPLIVLYLFLLGRPAALIDGIVILILAGVLAWASTRFIELPLNRAPTKARRVRGPHNAGREIKRYSYVLGSGLLLLSLAAAALPASLVAIKGSQGLEGSLDPVLYPGAAAWDQAAGPIAPIRPDPAVAADDQNVLAGNGCLLWNPTEMSTDACQYGTPDGQERAVLVGDSHAGQYLSPLDAVFKQEAFVLDVLVRNGCPFNAAPLGSGAAVFSDCIKQNRLTLETLLADPPDMVLTSNLRPSGYERELSWSWSSRRETVEGYRSLWRPLVDAGIDVRVITDSPLPKTPAPECVEMSDAVAVDCVDRTDGETADDPMIEAAQGMDGVTLVDLSPYFCRDDACPYVVGNVLVYRDNHITDSFAQTLAKPIRRSVFGY
ncbi:MAG: acyltransferase [Micrococcaceae bacterium]|nr:acyltransferase [Micrococcaceae bacterium]